MRRLYVLRHGKSDWTADYEADHERPLAARGRAAAKTMGRVLSALGEVPDLVLASTAVRAATTAELAADAGGWRCAIHPAPELYEASADDVIDLLRRQDDRHGSLLIAGHQPTCSELVARLIGGGEVRFPTAALSRIDLEVERWSGLAPARGELVWLLTPKIVKRSGLGDRVA